MNQLLGEEFGEKNKQLHVLYSVSTSFVTLQTLTLSSPRSFLSLKMKGPGLLRCLLDQDLFYFSVIFAPIRSLTPAAVSMHFVPLSHPASFGKR